MKKTLIAIACLAVGVSVFAQAKPMKSIGPVALQFVGTGTFTGALLDSAVFNKEVIGVYPGTTNLGIVSLKGNSDVTKNKAYVSWIPEGYNADGTTWNYANDVAPGGTVTVIGFKSKNVFLLVTFNDGTQRIYSVTLKAGKASIAANNAVTADKDGAGKPSKINGSTAVLASYNAASVASSKCYVYEDGAVNTVVEYDKKMVAKKTVTIGGDIAPVLPQDKDGYTYDRDTSSGTEISIEISK